jgi:hypothetical protein
MAQLIERGFVRSGTTYEGVSPAGLAVIAPAGSESGLAWGWRVLAAAVALALSGLLLGGVARLFVPDGGWVVWWMAGGAAAGALFGGLLESDHLF